MNFKFAFTLALATMWTGCKPVEPPSVTTVNSGYDRLHSRVLIRRVSLPVRAQLDWAAWSNDMIRVDTGRCTPGILGKINSDSLHFGGLFDRVETSFDRLPLSKAERSNPFAWQPVRNLLLSWSMDSAGNLAQAVGDAVSQSWGDTSACSVHQDIAGAWIHRDKDSVELWLEIEFSPWMASALSGIVDADKDGFPEAWVKVRSDLFTPRMANIIQGPYSTQKLSKQEMLDWANQLAGDWYLQYNTDLLDLGKTRKFPTATVEPEAAKEVTDTVHNPLCVIRGRPFNQSLYLVLEVEGLSSDSSKTGDSSGSGKGSGKQDTSSTRRVDSLLQALTVPTADAPELLAAAATLAKSSPPEVQGLEAKKGWLVFRRELTYLGSNAPDTTDPLADPVVVISRVRDSLATLGIDLLFVPIPTKQDIYPKILTGTNAKGSILPAIQTLRARLAHRRVESLDLFTPFVDHAGDAFKGPALYRKQDTHWSPEGLGLAAHELARRISAYGWYRPEAKKGSWTLRDSLWTDFGDLVSKLPAARQSAYPPEHVTVPRVFWNDKPYVDDPTASILVLGDSYTGVYQMIAPRSGGITARLAFELGQSVDLTMGWGGGPEAPRKLAQRGPGSLAGKKLVIWMMSARDLLAYPGGWKGK